MNPAVYLMSSEKKFQNSFDVIVMSNPGPETKKQLSISKLPAIILLLQVEDNPEGARLVQMRQDITYLNLRTFADSVIY